MYTDLPAELLLLDGIHPDLSQPRRSFDLSQLESLKADMAVHGLLQPILVRRDELRKHHVIVFGERRWRCAKDLGWKEILARVIHDALSPAEILVIQRTENLERENLNPLDEAKSLAQLQALWNCSREELAVRTRRSTASVCRSFKLLELPSQVQSLVETGQLPASIAAELHRCSNAALQRELAEKVAAGHLTRDEVVDSVRKSVPTKASPNSKSLTVPLGDGVSLRLPTGMSFKDCEAVVADWLRQLRFAKATAQSLGEWILSKGTEPPASAAKEMS